MTFDGFIDQAVFHLPLSYSWATTTPLPPSEKKKTQTKHTHEYKTHSRIYNIRRAYTQRYFNIKHSLSLEMLTEFSDPLATNRTIYSHIAIKCARTSYKS